MAVGIEVHPAGEQATNALDRDLNRVHAFDQYAIITLNDDSIVIIAQLALAGSINGRDAVDLAVHAGSQLEAWCHGMMRTIRSSARAVRIWQIAPIVGREVLQAEQRAIDRATSAERNLAEPKRRRRDRPGRV